MGNVSRRCFFGVLVAIICGPTLAPKIAALKPYASKLWPQSGLAHLANVYYRKSALDRIQKKFTFRRDIKIPFQRSNK